MPLRLVLVTLLAHSSSQALAQDSVRHVQQLYVEADYDGALAELDRLPPATIAGEQLERDRYRAMALIALGRTPEAHAAIERILLADPRYELSDEEAAPRIRMAFNEVRRRVLPQMARSLYSEGKGAFDRQDLAQALPAFERALIVIDLLPAGEPGIADLRTLVAGFLQLSRAGAAEPTPTGSAGTAPAPPPSPPADARRRRRQSVPPRPQGRRRPSPRRHHRRWKRPRHRDRRLPRVPRHPRLNPLRHPRLRQCLRRQLHLRPRWPGPRPPRPLARHHRRPPFRTGPS